MDIEEHGLPYPTGDTKQIKIPTAGIHFPEGLASMEKGIPRKMRCALD